MCINRDFGASFTISLQPSSNLFTNIELKLWNTWTNELQTNIDQTLPNKLHGLSHCKIGVKCVYNGHVFYTLL